MFAILKRAAATDRGVAIRHGPDSTIHLSYAELLSRSLTRAGALQRAGVRAGDRVAVVTTTSHATLETLFGLSALGAVPVPTAPPPILSDDRTSRQLLTHIVDTTDARHLVAPSSFLSQVEPLRKRPGMEAVLPLEEGVNERPIDPVERGPDQVAYIQCTSGSQKAPKPVVILDRHLEANTRGISERSSMGGDDVSVSWLPLHHDMGLVGTLLTPMASGAEVVLLPWQGFLMTPASWLWAMSDHGGTVTAAPCFGYGHCVSRIRNEKRLEDLDLGTLRIALIGSDPINHRVLSRFAERFASAGFDPGSFVPAYGLAEACLCVSMTPPGRGVRVDRVRTEALQGSPPMAIPAMDEDRASRGVVSCGEPLEATDVRIVAEDGTILGPRRVGEIQARGPSVMAGYLNAEEATSESFEEDWLRTGDLGYLSDGELFVVGRIKDVIIVRGRNYYAHDVETTVEALECVRDGTAFAFGLESDGDSSEELGVVATPARGRAESEVLAEIESAVVAALGLRPARVWLVPSRMLPKTTSGKKRRAAAKQAVQTEGRPWAS